MPDWRREVRARVGRGELPIDVVEELSQHLADRYDELRAGGMTEEEARRLTLDELAGEEALVRHVRSARPAPPEPVPVGASRGGSWWGSLAMDLRFGARLLRRSPAFTAVAVLTLALGIGANTAIFSVVNAVLLRPLGYTEPERLFMVYQRADDPEAQRMRVSPLDFIDFRERTRAFSGLAAHAGRGFTLTGEGEPELVITQMATAELFDVLGVEPMLGRAFVPEENTAGRNRVLILGHGLWQRRYGGDPRVVGSPVTVDGKPFVVVGVMPPGFAYPTDRYQMWTPLVLQGAGPEDPPVTRSSHYLQVVGRLAPGATAEQAEREISSLSAALARQYPESNEGVTSTLVPLEREIVGEVRTPLLVLLGAVGLLLLIACANVTSLMLARASVRRREVAIRTALGASRGRVVRQLLTENLLVFVLGGAVGLLAARLALGALLALAPADIPRLADTSVDGGVLLFTLALSLVTTLVFGLAPAVQLSGGGVPDWLRVGRGTAGRESQRLRSALVVGELALSLVLLASAGLAIRSFARVLAVDPGFSPDGVASFSVVLPPARYPEAEGLRSFQRQLLDALAAQGPVEAVGANSHLPLGGNDIENSFTVDGFTGGEEDGPVAGVRGVGGDYFRAMRIPVRRGRALGPGDGAGAAPAVVVNEAFARRYLAGADPLGRRLKLGTAESADPWRTVVGVSVDVAHLDLVSEARPEVYLPYAQLDDAFLSNWARGFHVVVRGRADPAVLFGAARAELSRLDPALPMNDVRTMAERVGESTAARRFQMLLLGLFAAVALLLATVGIFGVMSFFVTQRTREIGIRMALGAGRSEVMRLVVGRGAVLAAIGIGVGIAGALWVTRWMRSLLFGVPAHDPVTFAAVVLLLAATALLASWLPARRATRVDPMVALRAE